jgi:hypothetical protein
VSAPPVVDATEGSVKALRATARAGRRDFAQSADGKFARTMIAAMNQFAAMRKGGVSFEDAVRGIEAELRDAWPGRTTKFDTCPGCSGTGYQERTCCHSMRCARWKCQHAEADWEHAYVTPCDCPKGDAFKGRSMATGEEHLAAVGRRKKPTPKSWSQGGR